LFVAAICVIETLLYVAERLPIVPVRTATHRIRFDPLLHVCENVRDELPLPVFPLDFASKAIAADAGCARRAKTRTQLHNSEDIIRLRSK
jgi:hypothetical protein